jgi:prefoldin subunit 5
MTETLEQIKKDLETVKLGPCDLNPEGMSAEKFNFYAHVNLRFNFLIATIESLQKENARLRHRDRVVSLTNETLGRYVREGKEEIEKWKKEAFANHPTQWAYDQACNALNKKTAALESLQKENELLSLAAKVMIENFKKITDGTTDIRLLPQQVLNGCHGIATQMILKYDPISRIREDS